MRLLMATASALLLLGACAADKPEHKFSSMPSTIAGPSSTVPADTFDTTMVNGKPHFATPQEAMRFLADAWNRRDTVNLKHVTDPGARDELDAMHGVAVNLRLNHCDKNPEGDYMCHFDHDYPPHASTTMPENHAGAMGEAVFRVGPADTPGWYMTVFESCS